MDYSLFYNQIGRDKMYKTWHSHNNAVMLMLINSGCGSLVFHEKVHHFADQTLIFVNSGKQHYTMPENFDNYSRSKLFLSLDSFANILNLIDKSGKLSKQFFQSSFLSINLNEKDFGRAKEAFLELNDYQEKSNVNNSLLISACTRLISFFMELNVNSTTDVTNKHFITRAILYINQHIAENLNVEDICSNVFISKYYFCREFKKQIGLSVMKYILYSRISLAQEMMRDTNLNLNEIAYRTGFSSSNYFCNVFKKEKGLSPKEFRKQIKKDS